MDSDFSRDVGLPPDFGIDPDFFPFLFWIYYSQWQSFTIDHDLTYRAFLGRRFQLLHPITFLVALSGVILLIFAIISL